MIRATLFVYGHTSGHVNWGEREFAWPPMRGDHIHVHDGFAVVRHVEHTQGDMPIVITDWHPIEAGLQGI